MLWAQMWSFLKSWFIYPGVEWKLILISVGLALAFGAIWLALHMPPLLRQHWLWAVAVFSAFLTMLALVFVYWPLQYYISQGMSHYWNSLTLYNWLLLSGLPFVLVSALVQEGAKMLPMVAWWWRSGRNIDPKLGLAIGAVAGAGFGIFEAFWGNAGVLGSGWTWDFITSNGFLGIAPFWERFFSLGFHIAASSLAGYGLAKGRGWQFFLIAAGLHSVLNYGAILYQKGYFTVTQVEIYIAAVAALVTLAVLLLRWRKEKEQEQPVQPVEPPTPADTGV
jgi:RsiW-degrading membrane proteinase PrsW (M82 family)